ncbi:MAG: YesL family protein [Lachnospiraceae bacterium]|nr:YesL family protein [Lachnospiraceae bacterium]
MKWFRYDSPIYEYFDTLAHFIVLNLIFLVLCIPVITAGPAAAALYQITLREARRENGYLVKPYFGYFKEQFGNGALLFLYYALMIGLGVFGIIFWHRLDSFPTDIAAAFMAVIVLMAVCGMQYSFAMIARFEIRAGRAIRNSLGVAMENIPYTAALILVDAVWIWLSWNYSGVRIFMLIVGFSFVAYVKSMLLTKVFKKYENDSHEGGSHAN